MKVIIAGSRDIRLKLSDISRYIDEAAENDWRWEQISLVLSGGCKGVDEDGAAWACAAGIPVKKFIADWDAYGRAAGPIRNGRMVRNADALLVIRHADSRGSADVLMRARRAGLLVHDVILPRGMGES